MLQACSFRVCFSSEVKVSSTWCKVLAFMINTIKSFLYSNEIFPTSLLQKFFSSIVFLKKRVLDEISRLWDKQQETRKISL